MIANSISRRLVWDAAFSEAADSTQRWVLSAMQRYGQGLVTMLWRILGNEQDVCDAYQDTFLNLAHYRAGVKPKHIKAYLFRTANNAAISMLRRRMAQRKLTTAVAAQTAVNFPPGDLDAKQMQENLRACIARLPEHLRNVITLHDLAEIPYVEVGSIHLISQLPLRGSTGARP